MAKLPDPDDPVAWRRVWSQYPGQVISVSKEGAIRLQAGRKVIVRRTLGAIVKALWVPEVSR